MLFKNLYNAELCLQGLIMNIRTYAVNQKTGKFTLNISLVINLNNFLFSTLLGKMKQNKF